MFEWAKIIGCKFFLRTYFSLLKVGSSDEISSVLDLHSPSDSKKQFKSQYRKYLVNISLRTIVFQPVKVLTFYSKYLLSFLAIRREKTVFGEVVWFFFKVFLTEFKELILLVMLFVHVWIIIQFGLLATNISISS